MVRSSRRKRRRRLRAKSAAAASPYSGAGLLPERRPAPRRPSPPATLLSAADRVRDAEQSIRDRACHAKLRPRLTKDPKLWNQIVSSLDAIGDTEQALSAYLNRYPQDAVIHLSEAMSGRPPSEILGDKRIKGARDIRNRAVGHPTKKDRPKSDPVTTHQISRISLAQGGFDMLTADAQGKTRMEWVNVVRLIHDQREAVAEILEALDQKLDHDDMEARRAFKHERLQGGLSRSLLKFTL